VAPLDCLVAAPECIPQAVCTCAPLLALLYGHSCSVLAHQVLDPIDPAFVWYVSSGALVATSALISSCSSLHTSSIVPDCVSAEGPWGWGLCWVSNRNQSVATSPCSASDVVVETLQGM
jgi:hypothetical protein